MYICSESKFYFDIAQWRGWIAIWCLRQDSPSLPKSTSNCFCFIQNYLLKVELHWKVPPSNRLVMWWGFYMKQTSRRLIFIVKSTCAVYKKQIKSTLKMFFKILIRLFIAAQLNNYVQIKHNSSLRCTKIELTLSEQPL